MHRRLTALAAACAALVILAGPAPGDALDLCFEAEIARDNGEAERAIVYYTRCIAEGRLEPANLATAYNNRGVAYHGQGLYAEAVADYGRAIEIQPDYANAYYNRGGLRHETGDYDAALADFDTAIGLAPNDADAYVARANTHHDTGAFAAAVADYSAALDLRPGDVIALNSRGIAYADTGAYGRALADYDAAIALAPDFTEVLLNRGRTLFYMGRFADAVADLSTAVWAEPGDAYRMAWLYLAEARAGQGGQNALAANAQRLDFAVWPGAVIALLLGRTDVATVAGFAENAATRAGRERRCEAYFYIGQYQLLQGDPVGAALSFRTVLETAVTNFVEYQGARAELARLAN